MPMGRLALANQRHLYLRCVSVMAALALMPGVRGVLCRQLLMIREAMVRRRLMASLCHRDAGVIGKTPMTLPGGEAATHSEA